MEKETMLELTPEQELEKLQNELLFGCSFVRYEEGKNPQVVNNGDIHISDEDVEVIMKAVSEEPVINENMVEAHRNAKLLFQEKE